MDTLKSIVDELGHLENLKHVDGDRIVAIRCRLLALLAEAEKCDLVQKWKERLRATNSPPSGVEQCIEELVTWLAVNLPRLKAEARKQGQQDIISSSQSIQAELAGARVEEAKWWHAQRGHHGQNWCCERIAELTAQAREGEKP